MQKYTVFCLYVDNNQKWYFHTEAKDPEAAAANARKWMKKETGQELLVAAVVEGHIDRVCVKASGHQ